MSKQPVSMDRRVPSPRPIILTARKRASLDSQVLTEDQAVPLATMFKALGDPVRLRLMSMIASSDEICVCELTAAFDLTGPTISHHLRVLRTSGLVDCERRGTWVYYWANLDAMRILAGELTSSQD